MNSKNSPMVPLNKNDHALSSISKSKAFLGICQKSFQLSNKKGMQFPCFRSQWHSVGMTISLLKSFWTPKLSKGSKTKSHIFMSLTKSSNQIPFCLFFRNQSSSKNFHNSIASLRLWTLSRSRLQGKMN
jgi:hypothetical protein